MKVRLQSKESVRASGRVRVDVAAIGQDVEVLVFAKADPDGFGFALIVPAGASGDVQAGFVGDVGDFSGLDLTELAEPEPE